MARSGQLWLQLYHNAQSATAQLLAQCLRFAAKIGAQKTYPESTACVCCQRLANTKAGHLRAAPPRRKQLHELQPRTQTPKITERTS